MNILGQMAVGFIFPLILLVIVAFVIAIIVLRPILRVNAIYDELVRIRRALESMDSYIAGARKKSSGVVKEESKTNPTPEDRKQESSRNCLRCGRALYYPEELEKGICKRCS